MCAIIITTLCVQVCVSVQEHRLLPCGRIGECGCASRSAHATLTRLKPNAQSRFTKKLRADLSAAQPPNRFIVTEYFSKTENFVFIGEFWLVHSKLVNLILASDRLRLALSRMLVHVNARRPQRRSAAQSFVRYRLWHDLIWQTQKCKICLSGLTCHLKRLRATPAPLSRPIIKTLQVFFDMSGRLSTAGVARSFSCRPFETAARNPSAAQPPNH